MRSQLKSFFAVISVFIFSDVTLAVDLEEIHVTARRGVEVSDEAVNAVSVISDDLILEANPAIITDALHGVPGVFIQQTTPGQGTAIVRGLKGSEILHLVDGMRLNNALFRNAPNQYLALVDPWIVGQSEIVRGPLSSLYGSDAMGGVLQLITKRPEFTGSEWLSQTDVRALFDSATLGKSYNSSVAIGKEGFTAGASLSYQHFDDLRAADRRIQAPSGFRARAASLFTRFQDSRQHVWDFSAQYLEQPSTPRFDELSAGFGQTEPASEQFLFKPNSRIFIHGKHESGGYGAWMDNLQVNLGFQKIRDGRVTQDTDSTEVRMEDNRSDLFGLTIQANGRDTGTHLLTYGLDIYHDEVVSQRDELDLATGITSEVQARFPDGSTLTNIDAFVHDHIRINPQMQFDAGLRVSRADVDLAATANSPAERILNTDISGSAGLVYTFNNNYSGIANLARGFRAPNIFDLGTLGSRPGNRFNIANPALGPETVVTGELGIRYNNELLNADFVVWGSDYKDKIISVFTGDVDSSGRDIVQSQNASSVSLYGAELATQWVPSENWLAELNLTYTHGDSELTAGGKEPADRIPPLNGKFSLRYNADRWWLQSQFFYAAEQDRLSARDIRDPRINPDGTAGWGVLDVSWGFEPHKNWRIGAGLYNLFDREYRRHGSGIDAAGRHVKVSLEGNFPGR